jgi:hypothetical protein
MLPWYSLVFLMSVSAAPATSQSPADLCADTTWQEVFTQDGTQCVSARNGVAFAPAERARFLAAIIDEAAERYSSNFSAPPLPAAVVASSAVSMEQAEWLGRRGYGSFPWAGGSEMTPTREAGVVAHELGHLWFKEWFDSARSGDGPAQGGGYSSAAPDWIDEIAATLNENSPLVAERYATWDRDKATLRPLVDFLNSPHPNMTRAVPATSATLPPGAMLMPPGAVIKDGKMVLPDGRVLGQVVQRPTADSAGAAATFTTRTTGDQEDPEHKLAMTSFYLQTRAFADFLLETSGDPKIVMDIASAVRDGRTFEQWLATEGARHRLPATLTALSAAWEAWVRQRPTSAIPAQP